MNKAVACLLMLVLLGCDQGGNRTKLTLLDGVGDSVQKSNIMPANPSQLDFSDSSYFDNQLSTTMEANTPEIRVAVLSGFRVDGRVPPRLDKWLYTIQKSGGKVAAVQDPPPPKSRGLIAMLISVAVDIWDAFAEMRMYSPAKNYNATLLYGEDRMVKEIVFKQR